MRRFVSYLRVSTQGQGASGLGIEAQREVVGRYVGQQGATLVDECIEVEGGKRKDRPQLAEALAACRRHRAALLVPKVDRLARDAEFLLAVVRGAGRDGVVFCDLPDLPPGPVGKFMLTQMAAVAELEAGLISERTRAALAAAKARGVTLGNPRLRAGTPEQARAAAAAKAARAQERAADLGPVIAGMRAAGCRTLGDFRDALNARGLPSPSGRGPWHRSAVDRLLRRLEATA
ncbi:recombinase family protein [Paracraurococcus lichenis]|uniref:Recombinase family protein n=1 Tax=Paracraurococcus lichenis TaxID=3064888 RepID=A0ABT9EC24_9PROT|nr:recombinase family protein [Paracraurococcus sp. LOR1-02]MDO9713762.1 recombinase family protein [Paracraurococcus sp. LOR1-02]